LWARSAWFDVVNERHIVEVVEMFALHQVGFGEQPLDMLDALLRQSDLLLLLVLLEVAASNFGMNAFTLM